MAPSRNTKMPKKAETNTKHLPKSLRTDPHPGKAPIQREKIKKYTHGHIERYETDAVKTKFHTTKYFNTNKKHKYAVRQAARAELLLLEEKGYIEADKDEDTLRLTQKDISNVVDITSASKFFDLKLTDFGPYAIDYMRNGRCLLIGGRKGHVAAFDWASKHLKCEMNVMEEVYAVKWLHQETHFAVAQKKWMYVYDNQGVELHCVQSMDKVLNMEFLPYHFLLVTSNAKGYLSWLDVTVGQMVSQFQSRQGRLDIMCQNPYNATVALAHSQGVVTMWSPNMREPLVKMLCHKRPIRSIAIDSTGRYMATSAIDRSLKIWDVRNTYKCVQSYIISSGASKLEFSQTGHLAASMDNRVEIFQDCCRKSAARPFLRHKGKEPVHAIKFCPYEDVLGIGHLGGFTSILVPGAGEANFDALECNPFQTKTQRREAEVKALLDKIQPEMISLDPLSINKLDLPSLKEQHEAKKKLLFLRPPKIDFKPRQKKKGRSSSKKDIQKIKGVKEYAKKEFVKQNLLKTGDKTAKNEGSVGPSDFLTARFKKK